MSYPYELSSAEIGRRLRILREAKKRTQFDAASEVQVARTTLVAIEQGKRRIRMGELLKLANLYGVGVNAVLRQEAVHLDLTASFRRLAGSEEDAQENAVRLLNRLVSAELELEEVLGVRRTPSYPPEQPLLPGDVAAQAEDDAQKLRDWLGLGFVAVPDMLSLLELQLGVRIYVRDIDSSISGLFAYTETTGACVLLNGRHPASRVAQTAAHELGHLITARRNPEVLLYEGPCASREERYATTFARCFLTPKRALQRQFAEVTAGSKYLTRRHVIVLAHLFSVSREALVRRLEELGLAKSGTWDWFEENGGITNEQAEGVIGFRKTERRLRFEARGHVPQRLALLVREAWKREVFSEGQLARLLALDRQGVREVLDGAEDEKSEATGFVELSQ